MPPATIVVRFRRPKGYPSGNTTQWENAGETRTFKSWKAAWAFIEDCEDENPITGKRTGTISTGDSLKNHTRKINAGEASGVGKDDLWFLDVWGVEEKAAKDKYLADLQANLERIKAMTESSS